MKQCPTCHGTQDVVGRTARREKAHLSSATVSSAISTICGFSVGTSSRNCRPAAAISRYIHDVGGVLPHLQRFPWPPRWRRLGSKVHRRHRRRRRLCWPPGPPASGLPYLTDSPAQPATSPGRAPGPASFRCPLPPLEPHPRRAKLPPGVPVSTVDAALTEAMRQLVL